MSLSSKRINLKNQKEKEKEKDSLQSTGDTFFDSLHNSKISEFTKTKVIATTQKVNNFYLALKCMQEPYSDTLLLGTSEFSEFNPNQTKDDNISRYLHHPIIKEINKEGNYLIRIKPKQNYDSIVNCPYISKYNNNMKNIFKDLIESVKEIKYNNETLEEFLHKKNNNSINNNININIINNKSVSNNKKNVITKKNNNNNNTSKNSKLNNNKSKQINSTTITKDNNHKNNIADVQDIKKQIIYDENLYDLEESKDININDYIINEETKNIFLNYESNNSNNTNSNMISIKNKNILEIENAGDISDNLKKSEKMSNSTKKDEILVIDSFHQDNQNYEVNQKNENKTTAVKRLRKKYERIEFKKYIYNTNPHVNRYIYENQEINKDINIKKRKKTDDLCFKKNKKKIKPYNNYNNLIKQNININAKNFSELEDSLSQLSNKINKNLLDNFNNCGNIKANEFLMRNHNDENNINYNFYNNNQNNYLNYIDSSNSQPPAELLDFISNKSDNNLNNNNSGESKEKAENNNNNNLNYCNNNTFVIKNIDNKLDIYSDISNNNLYYELNRSAKSEYKINRMKNNPLNQSNIEDSGQDMTEEYRIYNNENGKENENNENDFYDFVTPEKNPEAIIRRNFSLVSSFYNENTNSNSITNIFYNNKYNSFSINKENTKYKKDLSLISDKIIHKKDIYMINSVKPKKLNISYIKGNKDKIRQSIEHVQPETVYDLTFYKNLIENSSKIKKINYKNILKNQKKIKLEDRVHSMVWMMQICEEFAFKRDTFHYACNYFDNYLTFGNEKIKNKKILELIGITCISISGKIEEVQIPKLKEYANSIDESFDIKDIIEMEQKLCLSLGWKLINVNINTWLNWYTCQWDLYIDSVDDIKSQFLKYIKEEDIIYYKKSNDNSYYNYRKICQLIDIIVLDYFSYNFDSRVLMAVCLFIIICINYKFEYNFTKKNFKQKTAFSKYIFKVYNQFINQSFDYNFNDEKFQKTLSYCYKFRNFHFTYELPLLYQIHQDLLENGNYEDFISYQTTNENLEVYLKEIIIKRRKKNSSEKTTNNTDKNKFSSSKKN